MSEIFLFVSTSFKVIGAILLLIILTGLLTAIIFYVIDLNQTKHAIRRNYPLIGRMRYFFEYLGEFFRQYFFAQDREEMPFNRAQRSWAYRAAKDIDSTVAFGSTRDLRPSGTVFFANGAFPPIKKEVQEPAEITFGDTAKYPFKTRSLVGISGMSFGALSAPAVRALSKGAAAAGIWINTGEGGVSPYHLEGGGDVIFQIGTAKYGARDKQGNLCDDALKKAASHAQVKMIEIKLSQGAKPGKGGMLPGAKVSEEIATIRGISPGDDSFSPNRHLDIANTQELLEKIDHIRNVTGLPVGFKTVIGNEYWVHELCETIKKMNIMPDFITIDSADGGTGAAPMSLMDNMGLPIHEALPMVVDILKEHGLRERTKIIASGKLINPSEVAWAYCAGADMVNIARGFMFALGCIQAMQCNKNTCPTGVTTHDKELQKGLDPTDKSVRVMHYAKNLEKELETIAHSCGVTEPRLLRRHHVRVMNMAGKSVSLAELYPEKAA